MSMLTVGCSEGEDATAWPTAIIEPRRTSFLSGRPEYEAIECFKAPKQGRSGGGLFTDDGYIAGVCDFAEPQGDHGLYATPRSIYKLLDRNNLMALYAPPTRGTGTLVADRRSGSRPVSRHREAIRSFPIARPRRARWWPRRCGRPRCRHDPAPHLAGNRCPGVPARGPRTTGSLDHATDKLASDPQAGGPQRRRGFRRRQRRPIRSTLRRT